MRTMEISKELLQYNQDFFEVYDFVFLMFIVTSIMFLVISVLRVLPVGSFIQTNLTFYILVLPLVLWIMNLCKNSFNLGYFSYTDETKLQLVMAVKAFIITQAIFQFGEPFFDFDIAKCHYKLIERLNTALVPFGF